MIISEKSIVRAVYGLPGLGKTTLVKNNPTLSDFDVVADEIIGGHDIDTVKPFFDGYSESGGMNDFLARAGDLVSPIHFPRHSVTSLAFVVPPRNYYNRLLRSDRIDLIEKFSEETLNRWALDAWSWAQKAKARVVLRDDEYLSDYEGLILDWFKKRS